jgi:hypothetical protein
MVYLRENAEPGRHKEAAMRRVTVQKPLKKSDSRRVRDETDERPVERPEIRKDIARIWWPDG